MWNPLIQRYLLVIDKHHINRSNMTSMTLHPLSHNLGHLPTSPLFAPSSLPSPDLWFISWFIWEYIPYPILTFPELDQIHSATMSVPLTKVDSAIAGLSIADEKPAITEKEVKGKSHKEKPHKDKTHRRASSTAEGIWNIKDLGKYPSISVGKPYWYRLRRAKAGTDPTNWNTEDWVVGISSFLAHRSVLTDFGLGNSTPPHQLSRTRISSKCSSSLHPSRRLTSTSPLA